jgi:hypothetical protein
MLLAYVVVVNSKVVLFSEALRQKLTKEHNWYSDYKWTYQILKDVKKKTFVVCGHESRLHL